MAGHNYRFIVELVRIMHQARFCLACLLCAAHTANECGPRSPTGRIRNIVCVDTTWATEIKFELQMCHQAVDGKYSIFVSPFIMTHQDLDHYQLREWFLENG